ncbi:alpha/beta hydrolase [Azospirillum sp. SYSU D00513]|uniref:RBBP9/YdeN family alpha/beta hydrolase n=1 Tax=Azospirillum sp. SYSU D00513 TaxID=2812561 RepID=UPI001A9584B8|nr:alpha/beta hydrolase [Azospirillum sp. SYSU D00513]
MAEQGEGVSVLVAPGLGGSGADHWQGWLQARHPAFRRVEQRDWDAPVLQEWVAALEAEVAAAPAPVVLVAHSLACILVAHWAKSGSTGKIAAALLVAPPDVESAEHTPPSVHGFAPVPADPLPFRTVVLGSRNDPYCTAMRACAFAAGWGADFIDSGEVGHINTEAGFGPWPEGERLVQDLVRDASA